MNESEIKHIWDNAVFVFDTSILLDLYKYSDKLKNTVFEQVLDKLRSRLFLPSHVKFEYDKKREHVSQKPKDLYKYLINQNPNNKDSGYINDIDNNLKTIQGKLKTLSEYTLKQDEHPFLPKNFFDQLNAKLESFQKEYNSFKKSLDGEIKSKNVQIEKTLENDEILKKIDEYFTIGKIYDYNRKTQIVKEGIFRYTNKIPPGYEDLKDKIGFQAYGDLFIWFQIIDYAKIENKPIIFISNDRKEDWCEYNGKVNTKKPRIELIDEFKTKTGFEFLMYEMSNFMFNATKLLDSRVDEKELNEIKKVTLETQKDIQGVKYLLFELFPPLKNLEERLKLTSAITIKVGNKITSKHYLIPLSPVIYNVFSLMKVIESDNHDPTISFSSIEDSKDLNVEQLSDFLDKLYILLGRDDNGLSLITKEKFQKLRSDSNFLTISEWSRNHNNTAYSFSLILESKKIVFRINGQYKNLI